MDFICDQNVNQNMNIEWYIYEKKFFRLLKTQIVSDDFHARFNATGRTYIYMVADCLKPEDGWCMPWTVFEHQMTFWLR